MEQYAGGTGIVVIGATFVDIKGYPYAQFIPGGRNAGSVIEVHGGVSRNIAEDIANVELRPTFVSVVDGSGLGADVIEHLKRHRCNTDHIRRVENGLGTWLAIFDNGGDVIASISKRPDLSEIENILIEEGDFIFSRADSVAVEFDIEVPILKRILTLAERYGKKVYAPVSNMSIAVERRDLLKRVDCIVCNLEEAGILFSEDFGDPDPEEMKKLLLERIALAQIPAMVVTMGGHGAVYATLQGECGFSPAQKVNVNDTTGCGDAFFAGIAIGLTYGKTMEEACRIGTRLASSVIVTDENVCPRFLPAEFGLDVNR